MSDTYYISLSLSSNRHKVTKDTYRMYMDLTNIVSENLIDFSTPLITGVIEENPPYYMRDNHTFRKLTGSIDSMIEQINDEIADGYAYGMLCTHHKKEVVHMNGSLKEQEAREWLKSYLEEGDQDEDNCNS